MKILIHLHTGTPAHMHTKKKSRGQQCTACKAVSQELVVIRGLSEYSSIKLISPAVASAYHMYYHPCRYEIVLLITEAGAGGGSVIRMALHVTQNCSSLFVMHKK